MMESTYIYAAESSAIWITLIVLMAKTTKRTEKLEKREKFPLHVRTIISSLIFASMEILTRLNTKILKFWVSNKNQRRRRSKLLALVHRMIAIVLICSILTAYRWELCFHFLSPSFAHIVFFICLHQFAQCFSSIT